MQTIIRVMGDMGGGETDTLGIFKDAETTKKYLKEKYDLGERDFKSIPFENFNVYETQCSLPEDSILEAIIVECWKVAEDNIKSELQYFKLF